MAAARRVAQQQCQPTLWLHRCGRQASAQAIPIFSRGRSSFVAVRAKQTMRKQSDEHDPRFAGKRHSAPPTTHAVLPLTAPVRTLFPCQTPSGSGGSVDSLAVVSARDLAFRRCRCPHQRTGRIRKRRLELGIFHELTMASGSLPSNADCPPQTFGAPLFMGTRRLFWGSPVSEARDRCHAHLSIA